MQIIKDMKQAKKINKDFVQSTFSVANLGGYTFLDDYIGISDTRNITFLTNKYGVKLHVIKRETVPGKFRAIIHDICIILDWNDINFIEYAYEDDEKERYKNKSVVGRSIALGVLTGGIGTIIGGMSGIGQKKLNSQMTVESLFSINFNDEEGNVQEINLLSEGTTKDKTAFKMYETQRKNLKFVSPEDKLLSSRVVEARGLRSTTETSTSPAAVSNLDEIKKLKELLDIGAITQDEFDAKKSELLNS